MRQNYVKENCLNAGVGILKININMTITETDKISIRHYGNSSESTEHYSWMFMEDFYRNIVPVYRSHQESVNCSLKPETEDFKRKLVDLLPSMGERYNDNFDHAVLKSIEHIANHLVYRGYIILEFVTLKDINNKESYRLDSIYGDKIKIEKENIIQFFFEQDTGKINHVIIPKSKCFIIEFPKVLGGKDNYLKFLTEFKALGIQSPMMQFLNNPLREQEGYNSLVHQNLHNIELWKKSKLFNWHHRSNGNPEITSYYYLYRKLNFIKSRIILRDFIIEELKNIIAVLSNRFGQSTELIIEGLIPLSLVDEKLRQWKTGELDINKLSEVL